jgi:hypothetical protein
VFALPAGEESDVVIVEALHVELGQVGAERDPGELLAAELLHLRLGRLHRQIPFCSIIRYSWFREHLAPSPRLCAK